MSSEWHRIGPIGRISFVRALAMVVFGAMICGCDRSSPDSVPATVQPGTRRQANPNIILIISDDQAAGALGFEGNPDVRTPRLDALAQAGAYFGRAYVPLPQCAPSRAAILTGLYPHQNRVMTNVDPSLRPGAETLARALKNKGYVCGVVGKWHFVNGHGSEAGFVDYRATCPPGTAYYDPELWLDDKKERRIGYLTDILTDLAIEFVDQQTRGEGNAPFFLWLAYQAPHGPYSGGSPHIADQYEPEELSLPASMKDDLSGKPTAQRLGRIHRMFLSQSEKDLRRSLAHYYSMITCMDRNVGRLVDQLRESGAARDTLVVFISDNGVLHGEHQMVLKGPAFYEELVRTPMIMWWPGRIESGRRIDALVSTLDLFPTFCGLTGATAPTRLSGRDLWPLLTGTSDEIREALFLEYEHKNATNEYVPMRGVVTKQHKYVRYLEQKDEELYDLRDDPDEMSNLIGEPAHEERAEALRKKLDAWRDESGDRP